MRQLTNSRGARALGVLAVAALAAAAVVLTNSHTSNRPVGALALPTSGGETGEAEDVGERWFYEQRAYPSENTPPVRSPGPYGRRGLFRRRL